MRTSELTGALLDYWVARAEGHEIDKVLDSGNVCHAVYQGDSAFIGYIGPAYASTYSPSTSWAQGGPIIAREGVSVMPDAHMDAKDSTIGFWHAQTWTEAQAQAGVEYTDRSPLVAAMRAYVGSKFGDEVPEYQGTES